MNLFKKISILLMFVLCFVVMTSCKQSKTSLSTDEIYKKAVSGVELPELQKISSSELSSLFKLNSHSVEEQSVYMSMLNVRASEIGIFKFSGKDQEGSIDKAIDKRLKDLDTTWSTYLPDQYELVKNVKKFSYGNVKGYVIADDANKIVSNIEKVLK